VVNRNIVFKSSEIQAYYSCNRSSWEEIYPSEKWVFTKLAGEQKFLGDVLDVGCACGGLGVALSEQFHLRSYTGVDIHQEAIAWAKRERTLPVPTTFMAGDILELNLERTFDLVTSLGCADWNVESSKIIEACWQRVNVAGHLVVSLRLTSGPGVNDINRSYQAINFSGRETDPELAIYVVFNFSEILRLMQSLKPKPALIGAYGYWGKPSPMAVTPFERLIFAVFYLKKGAGEAEPHTQAEFNLPLELFV
jgi:SAM-dependent methyltransferase